MDNKHFAYFDIANLEARSVEGEMEIAGIACPYNMWSHKMWSFQERFLPGAFTESLADTKQEVVCTYEHDFQKLLGTSVAKTLILSDSSDGLRALCKLPNTGIGRDTYELIKRRDIRGMSFTFDASEESMEYLDEPEDGVRCRRTVIKAKLFEVCFTVQPAYPDTTANIRAKAPGLPASPVMLDNAARMARILTAKCKDV